VALTEKTLSDDGAHVWMRHPETGGVWQSPLDFADTAEEQGWVYTDPAGEQPADFVPAPAAVATDFDPDEHTVAEVNAHLEKYADHAEEVQRVLAAERAGRSRTTIHGIND
jgi:hypothetical protein